MTDRLTPTRRSVIVHGAAGLASGLAMLSGAVALSAPAFAQNVSIAPEKLLAKTALPDIWLGKADAPVTIIEYASMTCSHCASFHAGTFKQLKKDYIDTGKVRMTIREFPFDPLAMAAFMLARCEGPAKRSAMIDLLFASQKIWAFSKKPLDALVDVSKQAGVSREAVEKCLDNKILYENVSKVRDAASKSFAISSTPTFFINGVKLSGDLPLADFAKVIDPMVAAKK
ncbi:MAG: DsbA family protein [Beijerinckiaceae bacterium]|jgi:protein-disulfide isomerase|nr:DsbA family protein [Beijerinckiaceae bacterium]